MASLGAALARSFSGSRKPVLRNSKGTSLSGLAVDLPATGKVNLNKQITPDITSADVAKIPKNYPASLPAQSAKQIPLEQAAASLAGKPGLDIRKLLGQLHNTATSPWVWPSALISAGSAAMPQDKQPTAPAITPEEVQNFQKSLPGPLSPERQIEAAGGDFTAPAWAGGEGRAHLVKSASVLAAVLMLNRYIKVTNNAS